MHAARYFSKCLKTTFRCYTIHHELSCSLSSLAQLKKPYFVLDSNRKKKLIMAAHGGPLARLYKEKIRSLARKTIKKF